MSFPLMGATAEIVHYALDGLSLRHAAIAAVLARPVQLRSVYAPVEAGSTEAGSVGVSSASHGLSRTVL